MKKYGKFEKKPKMSSTLLRTYMTSLLSLVLCMVMFFGTSFAWFTSEVNNVGNEIYIGTLDVELKKQTGENAWVSLSALENGVNKYKLFDKNIRWEPGYTMLETVQVINEGDLAFKYQLNFTDGELIGEGEQSLAEVAGNFDVWVYQHKNDQVPNPESYADISAGNGWKNAGKLDELLAGEVVLEGEMKEADVFDATTGKTKETSHTYTIAVHMSEGATGEGLMNKKIDKLNVKLVAYQLAAEGDAFGNVYDKEFVLVGSEKQLIEALQEGGNILLTEDIEIQEAITFNKAAHIDLRGHQLTTNMVTIDTEDVAISNGDWTLDPETGAPPVIVKKDLALKNVDVTCSNMFYTSGNSGEAVAISVEGGHLTMEGGSITTRANSGTTYSFAYCVVLTNGATFDMKDGTLSAYEPTGKGEAGESSYAVLANGSGTMTASLKNVKIAAAHYIAGANTGTLNIKLKNVNYDDTKTEQYYVYKNGKCNVTVE